MTTILFLSHPLSPLPKASHFPHYSNPISDTHLPISLSYNPNPHRKPKPVHSLKPPNSLSLNRNNIESTNPDCSSSSEHVSPHNSPIKMPTAPWMKGPLLVEPNQVIDLSKSRNNNSNVKNENPDRSLTDKVSGRMGKKAMKKIVQTIEKLEETQNSDTQKNPEEFEFGFSLEQFVGVGDSNFTKKLPWVKDERLVFRRMKKEKVVTKAELVLDGVLLERLRGEASRMRKWVKVMKAGVTQSVVDQIHWIWKNNELAMLKFDLPLSRNMERAREIVEIKTGGLVVWCKKDVLVIYRGCTYEFKLKSSPEMKSRFSGDQESYSSSTHDLFLGNDPIGCQIKSNGRTLDENMSGEDGREENIRINGSLFEREADRLLDGLGPRFIDWWRPKPLPVDADLLPEVVPGFRPPFRLCPPHTRSKLTDDELTYLRKLARPLPTHFVLGRNRKLQGLADAILKLWEKCYIAKIAVKFGALNTSNEQMAYELKSRI